MRQHETIPDSDWRDGFLFVGNDLALDFLNTRPVQNGEPTELLPDFGALLRWFQAAGLLSSHAATNLQRQSGESPAARRTLDAMRQFREKLRKEILAWEGGAKFDDLTAEDLKAVIVDYKKLVQKKTGKPFPQDAMEQLARRARRRVPLLVQRPRQALPQDERDPRRPGHRRQRAGHGVRQPGRDLGHRRRLHAQSRHRREGLLRRVPGERAGRRRGGRHPHAAPHLRTRKAGMPAVYNQLREITTKLEKHYRDMQDFEFTIQDGKLYMLQTRNGKRTGPAAVRIAVEMVNEGLINKKEAILRVDPQQLDQLLHPVLDPDVEEDAGQARQGPAGIARRRRRPGRLHRRRRGDQPPRRRPSSWSATKPCRTTSTAWKWPRAF